ncbi:MAG TPA: hypothetical protein VH186_16250 [Chloroflexia bacterium]|nr:hypothetical protein [Chloroflexia bacterium]
MTKPFKNMLGLLAAMIVVAVIAGYAFTSLISPDSAQANNASAGTSVAAAATPKPSSNTGNSSSRNPAQAQPRFGQGQQSQRGFGRDGGEGFNQNQQGGFGGRSRGFGRGGEGNPLQMMLQPAANTLGLSMSELQSELIAGKSLAQVAQERNIDIQKVKDSMLAGIKSQLDAQVQNGRMSQQQATEFYNREASLVDMLVNSNSFGIPDQRG